MRAGVRMSLTVILVAAGVLAPVSAALAADGIVGGSFSVVTSAYRSTPGSQNGHSGYNFFNEHYNWTVPGGVTMRWVRCDLPWNTPIGSSTGGSYLTVAYMSAWTKLGSSFLVPTCARTWGRAITTSGTFGYFQYFNPDVIP